MLLSMMFPGDYKLQRFNYRVRGWKEIPQLAQFVYLLGLNKQK